MTAWRGDSTSSPVRSALRQPGRNAGVAHYPACGNDESEQAEYRVELFDCDVVRKGVSNSGREPAEAVIASPHALLFELEL